MTRFFRNLFLLILVVAGAGALAHAIYDRYRETLEAGPVARTDERPPAPVEVAPIRREPIELRRTFSGTLEARAEFTVAPKVGGRIERMTVDLADSVDRNQVVAELDDDEHVQAVAQAEAELAVSRANVAEARSGLEVADRELERVVTLRQRGVASEAEYDAALAKQLAAQARLEVARAQISRDEAAVQAARIRLGYTRVIAGWSGGDEQRVVAQRFVNEGDTVAANAALLSIVEIDPINAVFFVAERDYGRLAPGQSANLTTDAWPGERFAGRIERIAPVFDQGSRQARVELAVDNPDRRLKPGMFIRVTVVLERVADALVVPEQALTTRNGHTGVFVVDAGGAAVAWREVTVGIRDGGRVQVTGEGLEGRVVTLGQQLLGDGSPITIAGGAVGAADG